MAGRFPGVHDPSVGDLANLLAIDPRLRQLVADDPQWEKRLKRILRDANARRKRDRAARPAVMALLNRSRLGSGNSGVRDQQTGLTPQQEAFCQAIVNDGLSASEAYRKVYNANEKWAHPVSSRVKRHPLVQARIDSLMERKREHWSQLAESGRQKIADSLQDLIENAQSDTIKLRAIKLYGDFASINAWIGGNLRERSLGLQAKDMPTIEHLERELMTRLQALGIASGNPADVYEPEPALLQRFNTRDLGSQAPVIEGELVDVLFAEPSAPSPEDDEDWLA